MSYSTDEIQTLALTRQELDRTGFPELIAMMNVKQAAGGSFDELMKIAKKYDLETVKPDKAVDPVSHPPFTGAGSSTSKWQAFALKMSDIDSEIIETLGREDLITVLIDKGVITKEI